jgi:hypothetical protein
MSLSLSPTPPAPEPPTNVIDKAMKRGPSVGVTAWKVAKAFFAWCEARGVISQARPDQFANLQRKNRATGSEEYSKLPRTGEFVLNGLDRPFGDHSGAKEKVTPAIRPWTLHDLCRSFASGLRRFGVAPHIVELALNHRSGTFIGVAGIYQRHRYAKEVAEAFK